MTRHVSPTLTWVTLVGATIASFVAFELDPENRFYAVPLILAVAALKARLVLRHFMALKDGPLSHRSFFDLWVAGCAVLIAGVHWLSGY